MLGALSITLGMEGNFYWAAIAVLVAMLFDGLDGVLASKLHATSDFGKELDSLADIVSFGTAPAVILYGIGLKEFGIIGSLLAALFLIVGAVRLARFKLRSVTGYFVGLPITVSGSAAASLAISQYNLPPSGWAIVVVLLSALMVSGIRFPDIKHLDFSDIRLRIQLIVIGLTIAVTLINPKKLIFLPFMMYIVYGIVDWGVHKVSTFRGFGSK